MYATVRRYRTQKSVDAIDAMMHIADASFADQLADEPGFMDYQLIDCGDGTIMSISIFETEEQCDRSGELAAEFVRSDLSDYDIERTDVHGGEVMVSRAAERVLQPTHH